MSLPTAQCYLGEDIAAKEGYFLEQADIPNVPNGIWNL